ncbi:type II toxin-antitoxin system death-on-curing family toxin [Citricoccus sp. GCM10030269]|uniref:type II toxin-antitoxin system death-on-curing family toxin n=1 Tax=Citricoccus sp. GCM10030269 TaxID=3273388 RepID=UPI003620DF57
MTATGGDSLDDSRGEDRDVEYLDLENALALCERLSIGPVRDLGLLESALRRPQTSLQGVQVYPSMASQAAALLESLVRNPALVDGNKRLGWTCLVVFLDLNGHWLEVDDDAAYDTVMALAAGRMDREALTAVIEGWMQAE